MIAIKYSETTVGSCHDERCAEASCPLNKLHVPREPFFSLSDIRPSGCAIVKDMVNDQSINIVYRIWMEDFFIHKKIRPFPKEIAQLTERKLAEYQKSLLTDKGVVSLISSPPKIGDEWV